MSTRKAPWTAAELALLGKIPDQELARRFGRTLRSVYQKRFLSRIPPFRGNRPPKRPRKRWTPVEDKLLGTDYDYRIAELLDRETVMVCRRRMVLGIPPFGGERRPWTPREESLLCAFDDEQTAKLIGRTLAAVRVRRYLILAKKGAAKLVNDL